MKKLALLLFMVVFSSISSAQTDYQCVNDCTQKGYQYQFCTSKCSFNNNEQQFTQPQRIKQTDYQCVNDCTQKGYQYQYCTERCSF